MPDPKPYEPGAVIRRREVPHGKPWMDHPVTVVADDGDLLAVLLEPGSAFGFHNHGLDLIIEPAGTAVWKDVEDLHALRQSGRMNGNQLLGVLAAAHEVS